jgi:hypothetical protein
MERVFSWIKSNPVMAAAIAVGTLAVLYFMGFFGSSASSSQASSDAATAASYYAAESAQGVAGDELQAEQINAQATTAQTLIGASADVSNNQTWAATDLAMNQSNNQAAMSVAPIAEQESLISTLGNVAALPPVTTTTSKTSSGFLGIGAGSSTNVSVQPNPISLQATQLLNEVAANGFNAGS